MSVPAYLVLSDGSVFQGKALGALGDTVGEVVFNTGMTGYQEILTDPSYAGQIVTLTYPLIGNYGINADDFQSEVLQPTGLVVGEACEIPSNWRANYSLHDFLASRGFVGISGVDTRALTRKIRSQGVTLGAISYQSADHARGHLMSAKLYDELDFVQQVSTRSPYAWGHEGKIAFGSDKEGYRHRIVAIDCGLKHNILRRFAALGVQSVVLPHWATADDVLAHEPDGLLLSPGPGNPERLESVVKTTQDLLGKLPIFGICLGNQVLCRAIGGRTYKLKFGHRGSNHPVKDLLDGTVTITAQNHGYAIDRDSLQSTGAEITQVNLNDDTVEGIQVREAMASSIQYHPEAAPGPWDSRKYFVRFVEQMAAHAKR